VCQVRNQLVLKMQAENYVLALNMLKQAITRSANLALGRINQLCGTACRGFGLISMVIRAVIA
jgi:hypothetical protein